MNAATIATTFLAKKKSWKDAEKTLSEAQGRANAAAKELELVGLKAAEALGDGYAFVYPDVYKLGTGEVLSPVQEVTHTPQGSDTASPMYRTYHEDGKVEFTSWGCT